MDDEMTVSVNEHGKRVFVVKLDEEGCRDWVKPGMQKTIEFAISMGAMERECDAYEIWRNTECVSQGALDEDFGFFSS